MPAKLSPQVVTAGPRIQKRSLILPDGDDRHVGKGKKWQMRQTSISDADSPKPLLTGCQTPPNMGIRHSSRKYSLIPETVGVTQTSLDIERVLRVKASIRGNAMQREHVLIEEHQIDPFASDEDEIHDEIIKDNILQLSSVPRLSSIRNSPTDVWQFTVLKSKDPNAVLISDSSGFSATKVTSRKVPDYMLDPLAPPGLTKIRPPKYRNDSENPKKFEATENDKVPYAQVKADPVTFSFGNDPIWSSPFLEITQPAPVTEAPAHDGTLAVHEVEQVNVDEVPQEQDSLPRDSESGSVVEDDSLIYGGYHDPFALTEEDIARVQRVFIAHLARKREKNIYLPAMVSFANPLRQHAPMRAWTSLPTTPGGADRPFPRFKTPVSDASVGIRSRRSCDEFCAITSPVDFLCNEYHCRECTRDSLRKKLLSLRLLKRYNGIPVDVMTWKTPPLPPRPRDEIQEGAIARHRLNNVNQTI